MTMEKKSIGRAKTILIFHGGRMPQAVISSVTAIAWTGAAKRRIRFAGPVALDRAVCRHIRRVILPLVDRVLAAISLPELNYELSVSNLGFASVNEIPLRIRGFSADAAIFLSLLSASLCIPIREDAVFTGHIASPEGNVLPVACIPEKLAAAVQDSSIARFVCPSLDADKSLSALSPREQQRAREAVIKSNGRLKILAVLDIGDLMNTAYSKDDIVLSALECGFFDASIPAKILDNPVNKAVEYLAGNNAICFWESVEAALFSGSVPQVRDLLLARLLFHIQRESYPNDFGLRLLQLVASLPPHLRRRRGLFPLLPMRECIRLSQFAGESDLMDVSLLHDAVRGKNVSHIPSPAASRRIEDADSADALLEHILRQIGATALSESVGNRVDAARLSFPLAGATVHCDREFYAVIESFFHHLERVCGFVTEAGFEAVADQAYALLSRAFARQGGPQAALTEGLCGVRGSMRYVLDTVTEQYKLEQETKRVDRILQEMLGPDKWPERVKIAEALLRRLGPALPPEIGSKTPEQCAHHLETLLRVAVSSMDQVQSLLRAL